MSLRRFFGTVQDRAGNAVSGAVVTIKNEHSGTLAQIYMSAGGTPLSNPLFTDSNGDYEFYASSITAINSGLYAIEITYSGLTTRTGEVCLDPVASVAGANLLTAGDTSAQRSFLGLGSAALSAVGDFMPSGVGTPIPGIIISGSPPTSVAAGQVAIGGGEGWFSTCVYAPIGYFGDSPANINARQVVIGWYDGKYNIQALQQGIAHQTLNINSSGGAVLIGTDPGGSELLRVGGGIRAGRGWSQDAGATGAYIDLLSANYGNYQIGTDSGGLYFYDSNAGAYRLTISPTGISTFFGTAPTSVAAGQVAIGGGEGWFSGALHVGGAEYVGMTRIATSAGITLGTSSDSTVVFTGGSAHTYQLPAAVGGRKIIFKNLSNGTVTISRTGTDVIDAGVSLSLTYLNHVTLVASNGTWCIIAKNA